MLLGMGRVPGNTPGWYRAVETWIRSSYGNIATWTKTVQAYISS